MRVVGAGFYHIIVNIFLILKATVYITSVLIRLVAVPVQCYAPATLHSIYIYICGFSLHNVVLYHVQCCLFSTSTYLSLVRQILLKVFRFDVCVCYQYLLFVFIP